MTDNNTCLIVGAGISGLMAATMLQDAGVQVTVLDKGRGVGGRMATRRFGGATFDHGAQYFTVRDKRFQQFVNQWLASDVAAEWARGFESHTGESASGKYPRYCGTDGMTRMSKALAENLDVHVSTTVKQIDHKNGQWELTAQHHGDDNIETYRADALLMTPPAEQTLTLMHSGNVELPPNVIDALKAIEFNPCFAVMALLDKPSRIPEPGGVFMPGEPISWMSDNQQKGISELPAVTIHAGPEFTITHYDDDRNDVAKLLIDAASDYLGDAQVVEYQVQRWRYSQPSELHPDKTLFSDVPAPIAFAGDAFQGARVEGAAISGMAAADALRKAIAGS